MNYFANRLIDAFESMEGKNIFPDVNRSRELAIYLSHQQLETPAWRTRHIDPKNEMAFVSQLLYRCAVDFCFRHFSSPYDEYEVDGFKGSMAMGRCFYRRSGENHIKADEILEITDSIEETARFFGGENLPPLLEERRANLREVALVLKENFRGDPWHVLEEARFRVGDFWNPGLTALLTEKFPIAFGQDPIFHKRAQLFALMYYGRAKSSDGALPDLCEAGSIGPLAEYRIPNAFRKLKIFKYNKDLEERIDRQEIIAKDSIEEFELRAAVVREVGRIFNIMNNNLPVRKQHQTIAPLDYWLYKEGKTSPYHHHLTPTTAY